MKWNIFLLAISLTAFISCSGSKNKDEEKTKAKATKAADIKVEDLEEPCEYADALLVVYQEANEKVDVMLDRGHKIKALVEKMNSIMEHGDKSMVDKETLDKCSSYDDFEELASEIKEMGDMMSEVEKYEDDLENYIRDEFGITKDEYKGNKTKKALKITQDDLVESCDYVAALTLVFEAMSDEMKSLLFIMSEIKKMEELETDIEDAADDKDVNKSEVEECESFKKGEKLQDKMENKLEEFELMFESAF